MSLYKNKQWEVTPWGLEEVKPSAPSEYKIIADQLLTKGGIGGGELYDWPCHVAQKSWVDIDLFCEAFKEALAHHKGKYKGEVDEQVLEQTFAKAREIKKGK